MRPVLMSLTVRAVFMALTLMLVLAGVGTPVLAQSLKGSQASMNRQNRVARAHDYSFLRDAGQIRKFVRLGLLVSVPGNANYELAGVSYPYARPAAKTFVERLASQYRRATGEKLVVTSLTRPRNRQPRNASSLSVHPTGMAIDFRRSRSRSARRWLESTLMSLEAAGVIEATRERNPPHYHVAVFPQQYLRYVDRITRQGGNRFSQSTHRVADGDTLWDIAKRYKTTVGQLKRDNKLRNSRIYIGQKLKIVGAD